MLWWCSY